MMKFSLGSRICLALVSAFMIWCGRAQNIVDIASGDENFSTLVAALTAANLVEALVGDGPYTVFAPTDAAFAELSPILLEIWLRENGSVSLTKVLLHHVVAGTITSDDIASGLLEEIEPLYGEMLKLSASNGIVSIDDAMVTTRDISASNGIIHVIDAVLIPYGLTHRNPPATRTIATIASASEDFSTLVTALAAAKLVDALAGEGPITVFAPTNAAFEKIPPGLLDAMLNEPGLETLTQILLYHVSSGNIDSSDIVDGIVEGAGTLQGLSLTFNVTDEGVMVDDSLVTVADIFASNGIVHVIDTVLIPDGLALPTYPQTIADIASGNEDFSTLVTALAAANLVDAVAGEGPLTVFAPTNEAFGKIPADILDALLNEPELVTLTQILLFHVVSGNVASEDIVDGMVVDTLQGISLSFVVNDDGVMVNDAMVTSVDIEAANGVIHVIDTVLVPEGLVLPTAPTTPAAPQGTSTIADIAVIRKDFTTLATALTAAGLVQTVAGEGPLTVFAPTNAAFDKIPADTLDALLNEPGLDTLTQILLFHVASGTVSSEDIVGGLVDSLDTLQGGFLVFNIKDGVMVNDALVTSADILASNGIIHVIDTVLIPDGLVLPSASPADDSTRSIVEIAAGSDDFTILVTALTAAGLVEAVAGEGPLTVFAPTNAAFEKMPADTLDALLNEAGLDTLTQILLFHVASGTVNSEDIVEGVVAGVDTLQGNSLAFKVTGDGVMVNDAMVTSADIVASNGIVHVIDTVLIPAGLVIPEPTPTIVEIAVASEDFTTLVTALTVANLADTLAGEGPWTVFAPTDAAFEKIPKETLYALLNEPGHETLRQVLFHHVIPGTMNSTYIVGELVRPAAGIPFNVVATEEGILAGDAMVTALDIIASNGIIHVIDTVLISDDLILPTLSATPSIAEIAASSEDFTTLVTALTAANLIEEVSGAIGPITVFAPTNAAFAKIPTGRLDALLNEPGLETLTQILLYHVSSGTISSSDIASGAVEESETLQGNSVTFNVTDLGVMVDYAMVTAPDLEASNGVIHVIDSVLIPDGITWPTLPPFPPIPDPIPDDGFNFASMISVRSAGDATEP